MSLYLTLATRAPWLSLALICFAGIKAIHNWYFLKKSIKTIGKVVEIDVSNDGDTPLVEFTTKSDERIKFRVTTLLGKEDWSLDTTWPVRYLASAPKRAQIDTPHYRWLPVQIFLLGAICLYIVGKMILFFS